MIAERLPVRRVSHPLGCHRRRVPDRLCFEGIVIRMVTGCSWQTVEYLLGFRVSDTTLRTRRDEWVALGVFDDAFEAALAEYDLQVGLELSDVIVDGSQQKAPCGGEGTGKSPTDRRKLGWKWSLFVDANGIPLGWAVDGANRTDMALLEPTLAQAQKRGVIRQRNQILHLDRGYRDGKWLRTTTAEVGITNVAVPPRRRPGDTTPPTQYPLGKRWPVERTNSWLTNYGQLRRNTDRKTNHRLAQLALSATIIIVTRLIDQPNQTHTPSPIR